MFKFKVNMHSVITIHLCVPMCSHWVRKTRKIECELSEEQTRTFSRCISSMYILVDAQENKLLAVVTLDGGLTRKIVVFPFFIYNSL